MALCPLAIASKGNANDGTGEYYFALNGGAVGPVRDQAFVAVGFGSPPNQGYFQATAEDTVGNGTDAFIMTDMSGARRWAIGMSGVEAGANSGDNFAIYSYADNDAFLAAPLTINRASGGVAMSNGLAVGAAETVGGGVLQVNGTAGLSRVYDAVYNRPVAGAEVVLSTFNNVGAPIGALVPYTPTSSGLFTLTMEVRTDASGYAWTNGTNIISGYLASVNPPFTLLSDSFTTCDSLANPGTIAYPSGFPLGVYVKDIVAVINLTAGVSYQPTISINGAFNLGATGGVRFFIQPLLA